MTVEDPVSDSRLFLIKLEFEPDSIGRFIEWFTVVHAPALLRAGFRTVNSFLYHGSDNRVFNIHEIIGDVIFGSDNYKHEIAIDSIFVNRIKKSIVSRSNSIYRQTAVFEAGLIQQPLTSLKVSLASPVVSLSNANPDSLNAWFERFSIQKIDVAGLYRTRFLKMDGEHPSGKSNEPDTQVLMEWFNLESAIEYFQNSTVPWSDVMLGKLICRSISASFYVD